MHVALEYSIAKLWFFISVLFVQTSALITAFFYVLSFYLYCAIQIRGTVINSNDLIKV